MPVTPEFQNPPAAPNYAPYFLSTEPFAETTVAAPQTAGGQQRFSVTVIDPNPNDTLYVRWVSDYPPYTQSDTRLIVDDPKGMAQRLGGTEINYVATQCKDFAPGAEHKLVVIVSDRKFRPYDQFTSDFRYNLVEGIGTVAIMTSWSIINCP